MANKPSSRLGKAFVYGMGRIGAFLGNTLVFIGEYAIPFLIVAVILTIILSIIYSSGASIPVIATGVAAVVAASPIASIAVAAAIGIAGDLLVGKFKKDVLDGVLSRYRNWVKSLFAAKVDVDPQKLITKVRANAESVGDLNILDEDNINVEIPKRCLQKANTTGMSLKKFLGIVKKLNPSSNTDKLKAIGIYAQKFIEIIQNKNDIDKTKKDAIVKVLKNIVKYSNPIAYSNAKQEKHEAKNEYQRTASAFKRRFKTFALYLTSFGSARPAKNQDNGAKKKPEVKNTNNGG